ncbi:hypothetical protein [Diaminobutyricimonas sp. LJ205]|uniref:DUF4760 domain-containing protein n=1 Tax=Diaminobutyricimonas sp. LJ205 TaxID=2683590 RepID=UPI0012F4DFED|nr:hypothetical protein [Diaminobutyricimonas sp. LJ205]
MLGGSFVAEAFPVVKRPHDVGGTPLKLQKHGRSAFLTLITALTVIAFVLLLGIESEPQSKIGLFTDVAGAVAAVGGAVAIWYQLKRARDLTEAEFIVNLNESFGASEEIRRVYGKIERSRRSAEVGLNQDDIAAIVIYLTFFETIYSLVQRKILTFAMIDDLFAYRFFLVAHDSFVQEQELIKDAPYYQNFYLLHKGWTAYRSANGKHGFFEDHDLSLSPAYGSLVGAK